VSGPLVEEATYAAGLASQAGATPTESWLVFEIVSRGKNHFRTMRNTVIEIGERTGHQPNRDYASRRVREMKRRGWLETKRIWPGQIPPGGTHNSSAGTLNKSFVWNAFGVESSPVTRAKDRIARRNSNYVEKRSLEARRAYNAQRKAKAAEPAPAANSTIIREPDATPEQRRDHAKIALEALAQLGIAPRKPPAPS